MSIGLSDVIKELDTVTDKISTQVRTLALGVLALAWLLLSKTQGAPNILASENSVQLTWISLFCLLTLAADLMQYIFGYFSAYGLLKHAKKNQLASVSYDSRSFCYVARFFMFYAKQIFAVIAAIWLVLLLAFSVGHIK